MWMMNVFRVSWTRARRSTRLLSVFGAMLLCGALLAACNGPGSTANASTSANKGITISAHVVHGPQNATLVLLPVMIHGKGPFTFALDTGASTSLISRPLAVQLGLNQTGSAQRISGVGGTAKAIPVDIQNWHVEQINLPKMSIAASKLPGQQSGQGLQGLIGSDIWTQFGTVTIDYAKGTVTVPKQIASGSSTSTSSSATSTTGFATPPGVRWHERLAA